MNQAPPKDCPQAVFDAILDTPEPDKWIDCGEVSPLPMFHMHTLMKYGEKCAFTAVTHGVKMEWQPRQQETPCGECHLQPGARCDICGAVA